MASMPWRASIAAPSTLRVCRCALMAALALALTALESLIPVPMPVPGMKLGIANVVTVAAAFWLGPVDAAVVLGVRIVLAAFLTGQLVDLPFLLFSKTITILYLVMGLKTSLIQGCLTFIVTLFLWEPVIHVLERIQQERIK